MEKWTVACYRTARGEEVVRTRLDRLPARGQARLLFVLALVEAQGPHVGERYVKHIEGNLVEVRGSGTPYRNLAGLLPRRRLILLHGVEKKMDRLPRRDIETARQRLEEVEAGSRHERA